MLKKKKNNILCTSKN